MYNNNKSHNNTHQRRDANTMAVTFHFPSQRSIAEPMRESRCTQAKAEIDDDVPCIIAAGTDSSNITARITENAVDNSRRTSAGSDKPRVRQPRVT